GPCSDGRRALSGAPTRAAAGSPLLDDGDVSGDRPQGDAGLRAQHERAVLVDAERLADERLAAARDRDALAGEHRVRVPALAEPRQAAGQELVVEPLERRE